MRYLGVFKRWVRKRSYRINIFLFKVFLNSFFCVLGFMYFWGRERYLRWVLILGCSWFSLRVVYMRR